MVYDKKHYEKYGKYRRARSRALTRLSLEHWNRYRELYLEEVAKEQDKNVDRN